MCWFLNIKIDQIKNKDFQSVDFSHLQFDGLEIHYHDGQYTITKDGCLCDYFGDKANSRTPLLNAVLHILEHKNIKKIAITKYWSEIKTSTNTNKLDKVELEDLILHDTFGEDVIYNVVDSDKFKWG